MSEMTTQEMIDWLHGMIRGPSGEPCERCRAIAARLKALEEMRESIEEMQRERDEARAALRPFAEIRPSTLYCDDDHTAAYDPGYVMVLCEDHQRPDISREELLRARALLDTAREV